MLLLLCEKVFPVCLLAGSRCRFQREKVYFLCPAIAVDTPVIPTSPFISQDWAAQRCTISYRAPELFTVERECVIDERTDIWVKIFFKSGIIISNFSINTHGMYSLKKLCLCQTDVAYHLDQPPVFST